MAVVFSMKMLEKSWEWDKPVYIAFIDLKEAFDRLPRMMKLGTLKDTVYGADRLFVRAIEFL